MVVTADKELQQLKNRFRDLAQKSYQQNMYTFTGFLGLNEQDIFWQTEPEIRYAGYTFFGGNENCERLVLRFGNPDELGYDEPFGIICIHISPLAEKFSDEFSHRDFLGALMNLGIDRSTLGDIWVGKKEAYLFCLNSIGEYICQNLNQVKHTHVKCNIVEEVKDLVQEEPKIVNIQVSSERIDSVIAKVYNKSRSDVVTLFRSCKVYVNGRLCENNARMLKGNEIINVRGFGKFTYLGVKYETKKGKLSVETAVYQ